MQKNARITGHCAAYYMGCGIVSHECVSGRHEVLLEVRQPGGQTLTKKIGHSIGEKKLFEGGITMKEAVWGVCLILFGIILLIITLSMWLKARSFEINGVACDAWVKETRMIYIILPGRGLTQSYGLMVKYVVDGIEYLRELPVGREEYLKGGDREIAIRYKKTNPEKIFFGKQEDSRKAVKVFLVAGIVAFAIGLILITVAVSREAKADADAFRGYSRRMEAGQEI